MAVHFPLTLIIIRDGEPQPTTSQRPANDLGPQAALATYLACAKRTEAATHLALQQLCSELGGASATKGMEHDGTWDSWKKG